MNNAKIGSAFMSNGHKFPNKCFEPDFVDSRQKHCSSVQDLFCIPKMSATSLDDSNVKKSLEPRTVWQSRLSRQRKKLSGTSFNQKSS